jgi:hypothetical protein
MAERSKASGLGPDVFAHVGSNPTTCKAPVAQLVERDPNKVDAVGSIPTWSTAV